MTQKDKKLLLKDLCARLPYGVMVYDYDKEETREMGLGTLHDIMFNGLKCKPYLRPMSSMIEEEREELEHLSEEYFDKALDKQIQESLSSSNRNESKILEYIASSAITDWLNAHHFDYRNLIERGLAIAVTKENNPYKQ